MDNKQCKHQHLLLSADGRRLRWFWLFFFFDISRIRGRALSSSVAPASLAPSLTTITAGERFHVTSQEFSHHVWGVLPSSRIPGPSCTHWCCEVSPGNCGTHRGTFGLTALLRDFLWIWGVFEDEDPPVKAFIQTCLILQAFGSFPWSILPSTSEMFPPIPKREGPSSPFVEAAAVHFQSRCLKSFNIPPKLWWLQTSYSITYYRLYWIRTGSRRVQIKYYAINSMQSMSFIMVNIFLRRHQGLLPHVYILT